MITIVGFASFYATYHDFSVLGFFLPPSIPVPMWHRLDQLGMTTMVDIRVPYILDTLNVIIITTYQAVIVGKRHSA